MTFGPHRKSEETYLAYTSGDDYFRQLGRHVWCLPALAIKALVSFDHFIPSSATHSSVVFCPILKTYVSKFRLRSCLTNATQFSDLSVLTTKVYDFKLVSFFLGHTALRFA